MAETGFMRRRTERFNKVSDLHRVKFNSLTQRGQVIESVWSFFFTVEIIAKFKIRTTLFSWMAYLAYNREVLKRHAHFAYIKLRLVWQCVNTVAPWMPLLLKCSEFQSCMCPDWSICLYEQKNNLFLYYIWIGLCKKKEHKTSMKIKRQNKNGT